MPLTSPTDTLRRIVELGEGGDPFALVTLLDAEGSTPAKIGARAIVDRDGNVVAGTIGGGALEGGAQQRAAQALRTGDAVTFEADDGSHWILDLRVRRLSPLDS